MKLLCAPEAAWKDRVEVYGEISGFGYFKKSIEPAGVTFEQWVTYGRFREQENDTEEPTASLDGDMKEKLKAKKLHLTHETEDLYALLGLEKLRWKATQSELKASLTYHPDKRQQSDHKAGVEHNTEQANAIFQKIQHAWEVLSNPSKRRAYDSTEPFDDSIPTESQARSQDFFKLFSPYFELNARFSETLLPSLGDSKTPWQVVEKFYRAWYGFKTWRDFSEQCEDLYDLEEAETREERRWMERNNKRELDKLLKAERGRIFNMVQLAERFDPRLRAHREDEERKRLAAKTARKEARYSGLLSIYRAAQNAARRAQLLADEEAEQERERKAQAAEDARRAEEQALAREKAQSRKKFRQTAKKNGFDPVETEYLAMRLSNEQFTRLTAAFGESTEVGLQSATELVAELKALELRAKPSTSKESPVVSPKLSIAWSPEELEELARALKKYPGGTKDRWALVSKAVKTKTAKECIAKASSGKSVDNSFKSQLSPASQFSKFQAKTQQQRTNKPDLPPADKPLPDTFAGPNSAGPNSAASALAAPASPASVPVNPTSWSAEEQKLFEAALKKYPKSDAARWDKIAADVGRSRSDCVARFKYIVTLMKTGAK